MPGPRRLLLLAFLTVAALASWYLARQQHRDEPAAAQNAVRRGYYLESARILGTGPDGKLLYEIRAEHAEQRDDDRIDFSDVSVNYSPQSEVPWTVNADSATIERNQQRLVLQGHVRARSSVGFSGNETEIRTAYLELDPDEYFAETDARVRIRIGQRSLTATGMLASLRDNTLELKSNVSGKFVP